MQDFCKIRVFQLSYGSPSTILDQTDTWCGPLHFLYNRTYHVYMHISLSTPRNETRYDP